MRNPSWPEPAPQLSHSIPIAADVAARSEARFDVVMLTTVHRATDGRIFHREAKTLADAGLRVCIVGPNPSREDTGRVTFELLKTPETRAERLKMGWELLKRSLRLKAKLYIFHDPELFGVGLLLAMLGRKVIYDCHENLPMQILQKEWVPKLFRRLLVPAIWLAEWGGARLLAGVIVARNMPRFPRGKTVLVRNYPRQEAVRTLAQGIPVHQRRSIVIYTGGLCRVRGIGELVEAFRGIELRDAELWLVGEFYDEPFRKEILAALPVNVKWLGWKAYTEVLELYQYAKLGALLLHPTPSHRHSLPVKLFEYLAAGLPVIATNLPELADSLEGCGALVDPRDVEQIRDAILRFLLDDSAVARMSAAARRRASISYTWEPEGQRLLDFCKEIISHG